MLDPGKRKCGVCYEDQEKWGVPIPNCGDPDGDGKPCGYPAMARSLMPENALAWEMWAANADQIIRTEPHMAGVMYTLNLASLSSLFEFLGVADRMATYRKVRVIFDAWREAQKTMENTKTKASMERTSAMRRGAKGHG